MLPAVVSGIAKLRDLTGRESLLEFTKVCSFIHAEDESSFDFPTYSLTLVLESQKSSDNYRISIRFENVVQLKVSEFGYRYLCGLDIADVSDRQLENIGLEVFDYENEAISFYCRSAAIESVEPVYS